MRIKTLIVFEELKAGDAKAAGPNRRHCARHAARMRYQVLRPNLHATEAGVANDAKLVLEWSRERDRVDRKVAQVHGASSGEHRNGAKLVRRRLSESAKFEIEGDLFEKHVGAGLDRTSAVA